MKLKKGLFTIALSCAMAMGAVGVVGLTTEKAFAQEPQEYTTLPSTATEYVVGTEYYYSYKSESEGFYSINLKSISATGYETFDYFYSIVVRTDPTSYEGTVVFVSEDNYPIYMAEGTTYYFDISVPSASYTEYDANGDVIKYEEIAKVTALFAVEAYNFNVTVTPNNFFYLPVTGPGMETKQAPLSGITGTNYTVMATDVPEGLTLSVYTDKGKIADLSAANDFSATVTGLGGATKIYLTSTQPFVAGLYLSENPDVGTMTLDSLEIVDLDPYTTKEYKMELSAGVYAVNLGDPGMSVEVSYAYGGVVEIGKQYGYFTVYEDGEVILLFSNVGYFIDDNGDIIPNEESYSVYTTVTRADLLTLGVETNITVRANETKICYLQLPVGNYSVETKGGLQVVLGGEVILAADASRGTFTVNRPSDVDPENPPAEESYYVVLELTGAYSGSIVVNEV